MTQIFADYETETAAAIFFERSCVAVLSLPNLCNLRNLWIIDRACAGALDAWAPPSAQKWHPCTVDRAPSKRSAARRPVRQHKNGIPATPRRKPCRRR